MLNIIILITSLIMANSLMKKRTKHYVMSAHWNAYKKRFPVLCKSLIKKGKLADYAENYMHPFVDGELNKEIIKMRAQRSAHDHTIQILMSNAKKVKERIATVVCRSDLPITYDEKAIFSPVIAFAIIAILIACDYYTNKDLVTNISLLRNSTRVVISLVSTALLELLPTIAGKEVKSKDPSKCVLVFLGVGFALIYGALTVLKLNFASIVYDGSSSASKDAYVFVVFISILNLLTSLAAFVIGLRTGPKAPGKFLLSFEGKLSDYSKSVVFMLDTWIKSVQVVDCSEYTNAITLLNNEGEALRLESVKILIEELKCTESSYKLLDSINEPKDETKEENS